MGAGKHVWKYKLHGQLILIGCLSNVGSLNQKGNSTSRPCMYYCIFKDTFQCKYIHLEIMSLSLSLSLDTGISFSTCIYNIICSHIMDIYIHMYIHMAPYIYPGIYIYYDIYYNIYVHLSTWLDVSV